MSSIIPLPFGKEWHCVVCWTVYPHDTPLKLCPLDNGHLHRVAVAIVSEDDPPLESITEDEKRAAMLAVHANERRH